MHELIEFSKPAEFQYFINAVQATYIAQEGWSSDCFVDPWQHILKSEKEYLNLPPVVLNTVQEWEQLHRLPFPWHCWRGIRSSRNLHSSQVLGLTVLGALRSHPCFLKEALSFAGLLKPGEVIRASDFEYQPENVFHESRRTSVDFVVEIGQPGESASSIYFEVKFLETGFGKCSRKSTGLCDGLSGLSLEQIPSQCLLTKEGIRYWELLPELVDPGYATSGCPIQGPFYQLARNVLHLVKGERRGRAFIVLSDTRAKYIDREVARFIRLLNPRYRGLVVNMNFQQLLPYLSQIDNSLAQLLAAKYGLN